MFISSRLVVPAVLHWICRKMVTVICFQLLEPYFVAEVLQSYVLTDMCILFELLLSLCADATSAFDAKKAFQNVHRDLSAKYPGHILPASDLEWIFVNAGGLMGSVSCLHASLTEYVLFFGTAVDTTGHSGRYHIRLLCYLVLSMKSF